MVSVFEPSERTERAYALMETMRMVVTQALVPKIGGGRVGVREYLVFTDELRERMLETPLERWTSETQRLVVQFGRTMEKSAQRAYDAGDIDRRWLLMLAKGFSATADEGE
jgi:defect-in-organelle-trafficking protein DotB